MRRIYWLAICLVFLFGCQNTSPSQIASSNEAAPKNIGIATGTWRAVLKSPGGDLPFRLEINSEDGAYTAAAHNGEETVRFDSLTIDETGHFRLAIDHYDSIFTGEVKANGQEMSGMWRKVVDQTRTAELPFEAQHGPAYRFAASGQTPVSIAPKWAVTFSPGTEDAGPAVAMFQQNDSVLTGTFLTPTGDYRYLAGNIDGNRLNLSCFDGGHAFLFKAALDSEGQLHGDFWSSDKWHEQWVATPDPDASLPDAMTLTETTGEEAHFRFEFPNLDGQLISQDDSNFKDKVLVVTIFGSWCPNCNDEAPFLQELYRTYRDRGLEVVGLAFEATGDAKRDTQMLRRFKKRHDIEYQLLLAGQRDKTLAGAKLPDINHVLAYPTTLFIDREGRVAHIHTGFTGPGTGSTYQELKKSYRDLIESLL